MNVTRLLDYANAANMAARVDISRTGSSVQIQWQWKSGYVGVFKTQGISIPAMYFEDNRWPFFHVRALIISASEAMEQHGGVPDKKHMLFMPGDHCMTYQQELDLLNKKLAGGLTDVRGYTDSLMALMKKRDADNALWHGANLDG